MRTHHELSSLDRTSTAGGTARSVVLTTLGVPLERDASVFAVDTAVESGHALVVANVTRLEPLALSVRMGYDALAEFTPEVSASVATAVSLASSLGVTVERLRIRTPRPLEAILELLRERSPGVLVFGPDRTSISPRRYRKAVTVLRGNSPCLVWTPI